jgi:predicted HicB family RNase H-like nuclease
MTEKQLKTEAAKYLKFVDWSEEDRCFVGRCPDLFIGGVHGKDEAKVYTELCHAAEEWIQLLDSDKQKLPEPSGKTASGNFVLRVDPALHRRLTVKARAAGESLNSFCAKALAKA